MKLLQYAFAVCLCVFLSTRSQTQNVYYIYSFIDGGEEPWEPGWVPIPHTNSLAMTNTFGAEDTGWFRDYFETCVPETVFSDATCTVFLEGGENMANQLESFLISHETLIENWVASGGHLFLNSSPNVGDGMSFGFGGVLLTFAYYTNTAVAALPAHAIFNGPFLPVGTTWSGSYYAHATISGGGITPLITDSANPDKIVCAELAWGSGKVIFGSMNVAGWDSPYTESQNLRQNILSYLACDVCVATKPTGLFVDNITTTKAKLHWDAIPFVDKYQVSVFTAAGALVLKKSTTNNYLNVKELTPGTNYIFKVKSMCVDEGTVSPASSPCSFTTLMRTGILSEGINIYPNPNNGTFNIQLDASNDPVQIIVTSITGQIVYDESFTMNSTEEQTINLNECANGIYEVMIISGDQISESTISVAR